MTGKNRIANYFKPFLLDLKPTCCFEIIRRLKLREHDLEINEFHATLKGFRVVVTNLKEDNMKYEILISPLNNNRGEKDEG